MPAKTTVLTRVFEYNGQRITDPNPGATPAQAVELISAAHPELTNPKIEPPVVDGDKQIYRIRVAVGDKG